MTEHIATAPKDGTKILCICSDGKTRYCWWFGCSDVDGCWMTEEVAEPVTWYATKCLPPRLKEQALKMLAPLSGPVMLGTPEYRLYEPQVELIRRALEQLPHTH